MVCLVMWSHPLPPGEMSQLARSQGCRRGKGGGACHSDGSWNNPSTQISARTTRSQLPCAYEAQEPLT